ncbi:MAG TPA: hypothetical protein VGO09_00255, partial [Flavisolibacter sp.]|nr:hypothetical protein [Flavisolibacter sp.]
NSWTFAGKSYKAASVAYINGGSESNLSASASGSTSNNSNGLVFTFITPPTQSTQMLITNTNDPNTVFVSTSNLTGTTTTFYSNDVTTIKANVTVNNGKIGISFPGTIWLHNDSNFNDSAQLSVGTITQQ